MKLPPIWSDPQPPRPATSLTPKARRKLCGPHFCSMKITQAVPDYAEAHRLDKVEDALAEGMKEKAAEFIKEGAEIY